MRPCRLAAGANRVVQALRARRLQLRSGRNCRVRGGSSLGTMGDHRDFGCGWVTTARPPPGPAAVRMSFRGLRKRACAVAWQQDACRHTYRLVKAPAPAENPCQQMVRSGARISANTGSFHSRIEPACSYVSCACDAHLKIKKSKFLAWESAMPWMAVWPAKSAARRERKSANRPPPSLFFLPLLPLPFSSSLPPSLLLSPSP